MEDIHKKYAVDSAVQFPLKPILWPMVLTENKRQRGSYLNFKLRKGRYASVYVPRGARFGFVEVFWRSDRSLGTRCHSLLFSVRNCALERYNARWNQQ